MTSISTSDRSSVLSTSLIASCPLVAVITCMLCRSSRLLSAKILRMSSSTTSTLRPFSGSSLSCRCLDHLLLGRRQVGDHPVQEQRRLIQQPLRRAHALEHDALGALAQLRLLGLGQLPAGEHDDRRARAAARPAGSAASSSKPDMSGRRRSSTTQSNAAGAQRGERRGPGANGSDLDVAVPEQLTRCSTARRARPRPPAGAARAPR